MIPYRLDNKLHEMSLSFFSLVCVELIVWHILESCALSLAR